MGFTLHYRQWEALQLAWKHDVSGYMGGIRSGKSITGSHFVLDMLLKRKDEVGAIFAPTHKVLSLMTLKEFKKVLASNGILQDRHYVVNKNPNKKFGYETKWPADHNGIWSFWNGAQIYTFSLESFFRGAEFGYAWGDEIQSAKMDSIDEAVGRMSGSQDPKIFYTFTPPIDNPDVDVWAYGDTDGKGKLPLAIGTTYDNKTLPEKYLRMLEQRFDKYTFAREVMCERVRLGGITWLYSFDRNKHVSTSAEYQTDHRVPVHVSLDFNVSPFVALLSHRGVKNGKKYIHHFDCVEIEPEMIVGEEFIDAIVREIKLRTPFQAKYNNYLITGDASARRRDVTMRSGQTIWSKVITSFGISDRQRNVSRSNMEHKDSRVLCNSVVARYPEFLVHPRCKPVIRDLEFVKADQKHGIIKSNRDDETQQADFLDTVRYDIQAWDYDFIAFK